ncbi:hydroxymyristoyl-ACP dehydratase [Pectobacteriaceae bacterium CE70]|uniref:Hydroxymyristoyl-ACP dehydratase n=1 Tax=Serratia sp. (strain ATCC 39006) TaxID=104623 RepID=A0A2I5TEX6_SERS3|nr:beta-hydroxyacyl-ACP dehydratase [Serratia sp. ATCC 39006]WJV62567.1 hydroxymyristoyl-ACP dehydratase [Pectobacteriaceae bacterium C52]WJV66888.1 hydroxymyristoyl-ACP dehydratase [Pectobacteriaceae bacterium CE70]WJY10877.1 hydroxymyristoyl-ACP dehydratase [Pectobacteriaceae bacterium C80]WJY15107.1 hydroxymyristoyl-ACP dehydratase [Pectobacteriaceae bacterium CE90]AUG98809.1 hydroxymyristoyl-ACP dehydratase [Serratia sp. ATCC 39006]
MLPVELSRHYDEQYAELVLLVSSDLLWFSGHFPTQPLLPGVAQLDWVLHYGCELLAPGWQFSSVENIKFQQPILPGKRLRLNLTWSADKRLLTFGFHILDGEAEPVASSGKIKLCR